MIDTSGLCFSRKMLDGPAVLGWLINVQATIQQHLAQKSFDDYAGPVSWKRTDMV